MPENEASDAVQVVRFRVGESEVAIDVMAVSEVLVPQEVRSVPGQPDFMDGLVLLRGEYHPAMDLRRRFGSPSAEPAIKFVVVTCRGRSLVLLVDGVGEVSWLPKTSLKEAPVHSSLGAGQSLSGLADVGDAMVIILDADRLLSEEESTQLIKACS